MIEFMYWAVCMITLTIFFSAILATLAYGIFELVKLAIKDDYDD